MQITHVVLLAVVAYVCFVALMEGLIGFVQPNMDGGVSLTTSDADGKTSTRKLALARLDGNLYISSNHWLRGWYREALAEPNVLAEVDGVQAAYTVVRIEGQERARVSDNYRMGFILRFICGFAPSKFLRLDPR